MDQCTFTNDDFVSILLPNHPFSRVLVTRDHHEVLFRRINTYLIKNKLIQNNIIDLGAWIGDNSIPWAKNIQGIVYAIDPSPNNTQFIQQTCELNKIHNVTVIQTAISNVNETLTTNDCIDHCSLTSETSESNGTKIEAVSLDYLYENKRIENIGYIHLDVEGMEYKVLQGCSNLIDACRPIISFEQHLEIDDYDVILSYLTTKKYKVFLVNETLPGCRHDCRNSFAFPNEMYSENLVKNINSFIGQNILIPK